VWCKGRPIVFASIAKDFGVAEAPVYLMGFAFATLMVLPWCQHQAARITQGIDERVDFGGQSSARSADRLRAVFFRAPALC